MDRKRIWGWWFFDWASQPYHTLLVTFIFSTYFGEVAKTRFIALGESSTIAGAQAQTLWGYGLAVGGALTAVMAPFLGAVADTTGRRLPWIRGFSVLYVVGASMLWFLSPTDPALIQAVIFFTIGLMGAEFALIFTNAMLPGLGPRDEIGRLSGSGFAFGYAGGVTALAVMLLFFFEAASGQTVLGAPPALGLDPAAREGTRFVGPFTALWYLVFMIPFWLWVREATGSGRPLRIGAALRSLRALVAGLPRRPSLLAWLASAMSARDGLNALYGFGGLYAATVLGWTVQQTAVFGIVSAVAAAIISWIGGRADRRFGPKPVFIGATLVLMSVVAMIAGMTRSSVFGVPLAANSTLPDTLFMVCGALIGGAGGVLQSAGRTLMVYHTTPDRATEGFGLYALSGKATAFVAPFLIAVTTAATGSQSWGIAPLLVMFLLALVLLRWVRPYGDTAP